MGETANYREKGEVWFATTYKLCSIKVAFPISKGFMGIITDRAKWGSKVTIYPFKIPNKSYKKEKAIHIEMKTRMIVAVLFPR